MIIESIKSAFKEHFNRIPIIVRSPSNINLIGEHTYCNDGYVLPIAIDITIYVAVSRRNDDEIHLYAESYSEAFQSKLSNVEKTNKDWVNYIIGVADQLQKWGYYIGGFNLYIDGDVPLGVALSSPAAVTSATCYALIELFSLSVPKLDISKIARLAEEGSAEKSNSIINQFTSVFGKKNNAVLLDCKDMGYDHIPMKMDGYQLVLLETAVKPSFLIPLYNNRSEQCEHGLSLVKANVANITTLRDVSMKMLDKYVKRKDFDSYQKCRFVVEENQRVLMASEHLKSGNLKGFGQVMFQAHQGLSELYQVSCSELDFLVNEVRNLPYVLGAKMMTGGFEGCTLNIVQEDKIDQLIEELTQAFENNYAMNLNAYVVEIEDGTALIL